MVDSQEMDGLASFPCGFAELIFDELSYRRIHINVIQTDFTDAARKNRKPHPWRELFVDHDDPFRLQNAVSTLEVSLFVAHLDSKSRRDRF